LDFIVVRLGKDSIPDIEHINSSSAESFTPFELDFSCKQVESSIKPGAYVFIYLGSDNNQGAPTKWVQGLRGLGLLKDIEGWESFQSECKLKIDVFSVFDQSLDQLSFLDNRPELYTHFAKYPVIGVKTSRNNSVQKTHESERSSSSALLTAIASLFPKFKEDISTHAPELEPLLNFIATGSSANNGATTTSTISPETRIKGTNLIFYGAPGTGKSFAIQKTIDPDKSVKSVFHAETMNSDFVGSLKPVMAEEEGKRVLQYNYLPGPFTKALIAALNDSSSHYWLVIEELNRAPAAAVFGEIFQLLDRRRDGRSEYEIDFPDPLNEEYINSKLTTKINRLFIPHNLSLVASMNSSDQGVMPLDTAFKRRWKFVYIPLDFEKGATDGDLEIVLTDFEMTSVSWADFAKCVNSILTSCGIPEDRHIGPYFLSDDDIEDKSDVLVGKLFMYLWDDVLRHGHRQRLFSPDIRTYGNLVSLWESDKRVFNDDLIEMLREVIPASPATTSEEVVPPK
jgi:hypothetical protein